MNTSPDDRPALAQAYEWVAKITAVALEVVVVIWLGTWLDDRFGTSFLTVVGMVLGPVMGFWHLLVLVGVIGSPKRKDSRSQNQEPETPAKEETP